MSYQLGAAEPDGGAAFYADPRDDDARPRSRWLVATLVGLVVAGVFAGGWWFAYQQGLRHGGASAGAADVPLIRADDRPTKVKPEKPGGMEVPDRDKLIYTQKRVPVEHLLPPPEKPMARPAAPAAGPTDANHAPAAAAGAALASGAGAAGPGSPAQLQQPAGKPPAKPALPTTDPTKAATNAKPGATRIQLGSVRSEEAARQEWERLRKANPDLLASVSAAPVRADLGDKGVYYRVLTAPVADADRICNELKRRNIGCVIAR